MSVDAAPVVWTEDVGTMRATYTDPDGTVWELSDIGEDRGYFTTDGIAGWCAPQFEIVTDPRPRGGENVRFVRNNPATITWPLYIWGSTHLEFVGRYRALRRAFIMTAHRQTTGMLRVARPDGSARVADVIYQDGFRGEAGENWLSAKPVLSLFVPDGAWRDDDPTVINRGYGTNGNFFSPFPAISSAQILGNTIMTNGGDLPAWPIWEITGPTTSITATNNTTGQSFSLNVALDSTQTAVITTEPPTVRGPDGSNISSALNWPGAVLWGLRAGDNSVTVAVVGSSSGTNIKVSYYQRYEGA
jgi:hypothetical protein